MEKGHYSVLRVSHFSQIDNFSIKQQKEAIETYARFHSIEESPASSMKLRAKHHSAIPTNQASFCATSPTAMPTCTRSRDNV